MAFTVVLLRRAQHDIDTIFEWIAKRSVNGAANWYVAFHDAATALKHDPGSCPAAPEAGRLHLGLRQRLFKTRRGRSYRMYSSSPTIRYGCFVSEDQDSRP